MKKVLVFALCVVMIFNILAISSFAEEPIQFGTENTVDDSMIANYSIVASNDKLTMFADEKGYFAIRNEGSGFIWYSHPNDTLRDKKTIGINKTNFQSEVVVNYIYKDDEGETSSYSEASVNSCSLARSGWIKSQKIKNGIKVIYDFYSISARIVVTYTIEKDFLIARVVGNECLERSEFSKKLKKTATAEQLDVMQDSYITSIWLLPSFGAGNSEDKGFVYVPDGCGAYIDYTPASHSTEIVNIPVYGKELSIDEYGVKNKEIQSVTRDNKVNIPAFSIVKERNAIVGFIDEGNAVSSINTFKAGTTNAYSGISAQIDYRQTTKTTIAGRTVQKFSNIYKTLPSFSVKYKIISDDQIDFADISKNIRDYYLYSKEIVKKEFDSSLSLKVVGAADFAGHFLGFPNRKLKPLTTFAETDKIIDTLNKSGVDSISINYLGWNNYGLQNNKVIKNANALGVLGGNKALNKLLSENENIYLDVDLIKFKKTGNGISKNSNSAKTVFDKPAIIRNFTYSVFEFESKGSRLLSPSKLISLADKFMNSFDKLYENSGISFNSIANSCYSDFNSKKGYSRIKTVKNYDKILSSVNRNISSDNANLYAIKYSNRIFNVPDSSSRQKIYDGEIPMYQMILHGFVALTTDAINQSADRRSAFLRAVETGAELGFIVMYEDSAIVNGTEYDYLFGTTFSSLKKDIVEYYSEYKSLLNKVFDKSIVDYQKINNNVSETQYENGVTVFVNYGDSDFTIDNIVVKSKGFYVKEEN